MKRRPKKKPQGCKVPRCPDPPGAIGLCSRARLFASARSNVLGLVAEVRRLKEENMHLKLDLGHELD